MVVVWRQIWVLAILNYLPRSEVGSWCLRGYWDWYWHFFCLNLIVHITRIMPGFFYFKPNEKMLQYGSRIIVFPWEQWNASHANVQWLISIVYMMTMGSERERAMDLGLVMVDQKRWKNGWRSTHLPTKLAISSLLLYSPRYAPPLIYMGAGHIIESAQSLVLPGGAIYAFDKFDVGVKIILDLKILGRSRNKIMSCLSLLT